MGNRNLGVDPVDISTEVTEDRRTSTQRMYRRTDVVQEAGQRQLFGSRPPTDLICSFNHKDSLTGAGEMSSGSQPVRASANHDDVIARHHPIVAHLGC